MRRELFSISPDAHRGVYEEYLKAAFFWFGQDNNWSDFQFRGRAAFFAAQRETDKERVQQGLNVCQLEIALFSKTGTTTPAASYSLHPYRLLLMFPKPLKPLAVK